MGKFDVIKSHLVLELHINKIPFTHVGQLPFPKGFPPDKQVHVLSSKHTGCDCDQTRGNLSSLRTSHISLLCFERFIHISAPRLRECSIWLQQTMTMQCQAWRNIINKSSRNLWSSDQSFTVRTIARECRAFTHGKVIGCSTKQTHRCNDEVIYVLGSVELRVPKARPTLGTAGLCSNGDTVTEEYKSYSTLT